MKEIEQLNQERQRLMNDFLKVKAELARIKAEKENLETENRTLKVQLEERETEFTNLFSHMQELG
jgi:predicted  nucleic acid-binding Zn-ribbon protein